MSNNYKNETAVIANGTKIGICMYLQPRIKYAYNPLIKLPIVKEQNTPQKNLVRILGLIASTPEWKFYS